MLSTNHSPQFILLLIAALGFLIGIAKGGFSGLGVALTPLLSLVLPVSTAVGVLLPLLIAGDAFAVYSYWGEWDRRLVWRMLPAGLVGALAGTYLLTVMPPDGLRLLLAGFVLLLVAYKVLSDRGWVWAYQPRLWHAPAAGVLAGLASGLFNSGGPPVNSYLLLQKLAPRAFVATTVLFFALLNLLKVPGFLYTGVLDLPVLLTVWWAFPFIPLGILAARVLITRLDQRRFEWLILSLLVLSSLLLIAQSR